MRRFSVICLQCGLSIDRLVDAKMAQTEIHPVTYQQKCKIAPDAADSDLSGIRTRRRKVETLGPDFPERHVSSRVQR